MASKTTDSIDSICPICHEDTDQNQISHAVYICDHHICFKCSTRLRCLLQQLDCPICRKVSRKVLFVHKIRRYQAYNTRGFLWDNQCKALFEDQSIKQTYKELTAHKCLLCPEETEPLKSFKALQDHVKREHKLFYCEICSKNVKFFSRERKSYNRRDLALHKRKGDADDKSFKGHPLCEICDNRFLDTDELWRHLRKDHFFCHFCDADGEHIYFGEYEDVARHFRSEHYLCEEDECSNVQFINSFRTEMDLKAHKAKEHFRSAKRSFQKQARTLLTFSSGDSKTNPSSKEQRNRQAGSNITADDYYEVNQARQANTRIRKEDSDTKKAIAASLHAAKPTVQAEEIPVIHPEDFPSLGGASSATPPLRNSPYMQRKVKTTGLVMYDDDQPEEEYPLLVTHSSKPVEVSKPKKVSSAAPLKSKSNPWNSTEEEFPSLGNAKMSLPASHGWHIPKPQQPKLKFITNSKPCVHSSKDFPSLGNTPSLASIGTWVRNQERSSSQSSTAVEPVRKQSVEKTLANTKTQRPASPPEKAFESRMSELRPDVEKTKKKKKSKCNIKRLEEQIVALGSEESANQEYAELSLPDSLVDSVPEGQKIDALISGEMINSKTLTPSDFPTLGSAQIPSRHQWEVHSIDLVTNNDFPELKTSDTKTKSELSDSEYILGLSMSDTKPKPPPPDLSDSKDFPGLGKSVSKTKPAPHGLSVSEDFPGLSKPVTKTKPAPPGLSDSKVFPGLEKSVTKTKPAPPGLSDGKDFPGLGKSVTKTKPAPPGLSDSKDFPGLGKFVTKTKAAPPGLSDSKVFPGLSRPVTKTKTAPPAMFNGRRSPSGMLNGAPPGILNPATSSLDSIANMLSVTNTYKQYIEPINFQQRNKELALHLKDLLIKDSDKFQQFKSLSTEYRSGQVNAKNFYADCKSLLGSEILHEILPELVVLLPDLEKQQDLYSCIQQNNSSSDKSWKTAADSLMLCPVCQQVLISQDVAHHAEHHVDNHY